LMAFPSPYDGASLASIFDHLEVNDLFNRRTAVGRPQSRTHRSGEGQEGEEDKRPYLRLLSRTMAVIV
jgi:hypothetical protein